VKLLKEAEKFARAAHKGQTRKYNGEAYISHPLRVANRLRALKFGYEIVAAGMLHDVLEDSTHTLRELQIRFGNNIADLVQEVTNPSKGSKKSRAERKEMDRKHLAEASKEAKIIKLLDRIDNLRDMNGAPSDFKRLYLEESKLLAEALKGADKKLHQELLKVIAQQEETL